MSNRGQSFVGNILVLFVVVVTASSLLTDLLPEDSCVCTVEEAGVNRKAGYAHPIVTYLQPATCLLTAGSLASIYGASWYSLKIESQILWCDGKHLINGTISNDVCSF